MAQLYGEIAAATAAAPSFQGVRLPADPADVWHVADSAALQRAVMGGTSFIVLSPGAYKAHPMIGCFEVGRDTTLLGIGNVRLTSSVSHAVWLQKGCTTLVNMQLVGSGNGATVCVSPQGVPDPRNSSSAAIPSIRMIDCRVEDYTEAGLLLDGGHGELFCCCFRRCRLHTIEVAGRSICRPACQASAGVAAYGGERSVQLTRCTITCSSKEGVLAAGMYENAATAAQAAPGMPGKRPGGFCSESARIATEQAEAWGRQKGDDLTVEVTCCTIADCGNFRISLDSGCSAGISRCRLQSNDPSGVFVKGGCDVVIAACQFVYAGKSAKSKWAQSSGRGSLKLAGARLGANYAGEVQVHGCAFAGPEEEAVHADFAAGCNAVQGARVNGMWSKPPTVVASTYHGRPEQLPAIEALAAKLHLAAGKGGSVMGSSSSHHISCEFVLHDGNISRLARDAVMLHMAAELSAPPEAVLAVKAANLPQLAERQVRAVRAAWAGCNISLTQLLQMRDDLNSSTKALDAAVQLSQLAVSSSNSGSSSSKSTAAVLKQYTVYFTSSICRAVDMAPESPECMPTAQRLLATLRPQLSAAVAGLQGGWLSVQLVPGDVLTVAAVGNSMPCYMDSGEGQGGSSSSSSSSGSGKPSASGNGPAALQLFDYIDTSNVSDCTSLPALLQACSALLAPAPHARLRLESNVAFNRRSNAAAGALPAQRLIQACLGA
ncbi:hypothetical protein COO60DRAFT_1633237 [Scenedesmus sp. NREL 46B-D3]|nr:hypothetical protein COO60DRAFT_1633237 [Scenedesmus sp. NREL 46B-D3]